MTALSDQPSSDALYQVIGLPAFADNYIWLLETLADLPNSGQRSLAVVDPGDAAPVIAYCRQHHAVPTHILLTHHHADHTGGVAEIVAWVHHTYPDQTIQVLGPQTEEIAGVSDSLLGGETRMLFPGVLLEVIAMPGHTRGHLAYFIAGHPPANPPALFSGDVLFGLGCGRLFEGTATQMYATLARIKLLPDTTRIYCAHEYTLMNLPFALAVDPENRALQQRAAQIHALRNAGQPTVPLTLADERQTNPFLRSELAALAESVCAAQGASSCEVFAALRKMRDTYQAPR